MPDFSIEDTYDSKLIAGIDEAGRGPLAGPVVAAAVIVDRNNIIMGIKDSKKISANNRERLYSEIVGKYIWSVGIVGPEEIDRINILEATKKACKIAEKSLSQPPITVIIDGNMKFSDSRFYSVIKGDDKSYSIAAASIIAKVTRDRIMHQLHYEYPQYKWNSNVGYGTKDHLLAIREHGLTPHHRRSFRAKLPE